jgi:adenosylhomocysteine nucleosidase
VASADEKLRLNLTTGASLVDMESGAVAMVAAAARVPFAVLRAICDPADRALPPAALVALDTAGRLAATRLAMSLLVNPRQVMALFGLARDATAARRALRARAMQFSPARRVPDRPVSDDPFPNDISSEEILSEGIL